MNEKFKEREEKGKKKNLPVEIQGLDLILNKLI